MSGGVAGARAVAPGAERPSYAEASRELLRTTVLDAIGRLLGDRPWSDVTMAEVAATAGVSRQTLYNAFGSRQELAAAYVRREAEAFVAGAEQSIRAHSDDPRGAVRSAFAAFLAEASSHPLARAILGSEGGEELLALLTTRGESVIELASERIGATILDVWPQLAVGEARLVAETIVRLAISHVSLPTSSPEQAAEAMSRLFGPLVDELLA